MRPIERITKIINIRINPEADPFAISSEFSGRDDGRTLRIDSHQTYARRHIA